MYTITAIKFMRNNYLFIMTFHGNVRRRNAYVITDNTDIIKI